MNFPQYLVSQGYKPHRKKFSKENKQWVYQECYYDGQYSTMISGMLDYRFLKDGKEIIFGLNELGLPPTIQYPRPKGIQFDRDMEKYLFDHGNEQTLKEIEKHR